MNLLEFIAAIVGAIAWPAVVLAAVILLRKPLAKLVPLLRHAKYKDLELDFSEEVKGLSDEAGQTLGPLTAAPALAPVDEHPLLQLASASPRAAVVEAWRLLEVAARKAIASRDVPVQNSRALSGPQLTRTLGLAQVMDNPSRSMMDRMRMLRNQAVHADDFYVDESSAREYVEIAVALIRRIDEETR